MPLDHSTLVSLGSTLPPSLQVFSQLEQRMHDPFVDVTDLVALIRTDASLTFKLLRLANSIMFGRREPCDSLDEAVARVGIREIQRLVGLASTHQAYQHDLATYGLAAAKLWDNALATALAAETLARAVGRRTEGVYAAGLMRNLGRIVLDRVRAGARYPGEEAAPDVAAWEESVFGVTNFAVSADLLQHWRLPPEIVSAVRHHAAPLDAPEPSADAALLHLAAGLASRLDAGLAGERGRWTTDEAVLSAAGLDASALEGAEPELHARFLQARSAFDALHKAA
jgi:HD-like signal output (HDOD) protein